MVVNFEMPSLNEFMPSACAGCAGPIQDRYYLLVAERAWHTNCLRCTECKLPLDSELTCFAKDGNIYCKDDYYRLFATKNCARCSMGISTNELVMRAKDFVYHINCFTCASCHKALIPGEQFGLKDHLVYCQTHYEMVMQNNNMNMNVPPFYNGTGTGQKGRPRKRKNQDQDQCINQQSLGLDCLDFMGNDGYSSQQMGRQKRLRTSFKHHQLRVMKSYFTLNHNPDAKDLKQLAQKTGLTKRVLQVWFQNARAKYRRGLIRSDGNDIETKNGSDNNNSCSGSDCETKSEPQLTELSSVQSPDSMSDDSSSLSLTELGSHVTDISSHNDNLEGEHDFSDMFRDNNSSSGLLKLSNIPGLITCEM